ncbi:nuclear factor erythroid 2-related factor 3-like, partial [Gracilinanus agilis]|uniref:nuclear factor erythroid 2-related factor 3-like n=1 Tax=Gracilinanus agilis TaxID=191870 RepID=UPI001CFE3167
NDGDEPDPALALEDIFHWMAPHMENSLEGIPDCPGHPGAGLLLGSSAGERWQDFLSLPEPLPVVPLASNSVDSAGPYRVNLSRAISQDVSLGEAVLWGTEAPGRAPGAWSPPEPEGAEARAPDLLFDLDEISLLSLALEEGFEPIAVPQLFEEADSDSGLSLDSSRSSASGASRGCSASPEEDEGAGPRGAAGGHVLHVLHNHTYYLPTRPHGAEARHPAHCSGLPFSPEEITSMPVESFNSVLAGSRLSAEEAALLRDVRRRGKNKVAAQNCRQRKLEVLLSLERDVGALRAQRDGLRREAAHCHKALGLLRRQLHSLARDIFGRLRDEQGRPVDPDLYALRCSRDGSVLVVPKELTASGLRRENPKEKGGKQWPPGCRWNGPNSLEARYGATILVFSAYPQGLSKEDSR